MARFDPGFKAMVLTAVLAMPAPALGQENFTVQLMPPQAGDGYAPMEALRIDLPPDMDIMELTTLGVELDGIDVTAMLAIVEDDFVFQPVDALAPGTHRLRLVRLGQAHNEIAAWDVRVNSGSMAAQESSPAPTETLTEPEAIAEADIKKAEEWLRSGSFESNNVLNASHRLHGAGDPERTQLSGGGTMAGSATHGSWSYEMDANYFVETDSSLSATGNSADLGEYRLNISRDMEDWRAGLNLGHHDITQSVGLSSFLFEPQIRRGASLVGSSADGRFKGGVFALRPDTVIGAAQPTGFLEEDNRIMGGMLSVQPFTEEYGGLRVATLYYSGQGKTGGYGVGEALPGQTADGAGNAFIADKYFWGNRLYARGELALADYDADGSASAEQERNSKAHSLLLEVRPFDDMKWADHLVDILFGAEREQVDTYFSSLANPYLAPDRRLEKAYTQVTVGSWQNDLTFGRETNNIDDLPDAPTDRLHFVQLDSTYYFATQEGRLRWLGTPFVRASTVLSEVGREKTPIAYTGPGTDLESQTFGLEFGSQYESLSWNLGHNIALYDDHTGMTDDTENHITTLGLYYAPDEYLTLSASGQIGNYRNGTTSLDQRDTNLSLGVYYALIPDKLNVNVYYNLNLADYQTDSQDVHSFNGEVEWVMLPARANVPGVSLALNAVLEDGYETTTSQADESDIRILGILRVQAPFAWYR